MKQRPLIRESGCRGRPCHGKFLFDPESALAAVGRAEEIMPKTYMRIAIPLEL